MKIAPLRKAAVLRIIAVFFVSYVFSLFLWIGIKDYYGYAVTFVASRSVSVVKNINVLEIVRDGDTIKPVFSLKGKESEFTVGIPIKTSLYTLNMPLTFGIMACLFPIIRKRTRAYGEALAILFSVHLLNVFLLESKVLTQVFQGQGIEEPCRQCLNLYQFLWNFISSMVIRFEPFLLGFYIFVRFRK
jgi:hypothetical protein